MCAKFLKYPIICITARAADGETREKIPTHHVPAQDATQCYWRKHLKEIKRQKQIERPISLT